MTRKSFCSSPTGSAGFRCSRAGRRNSKRPARRISTHSPAAACWASARRCCRASHRGAARSSGALRVRPTAVRYRPRRAGSAGNRFRSRAERRRDSCEFLHDRCRGEHHRSPRRTHRQRHRQKLCEKLDRITIPGVEVFVRPVKEYRAVIVFRGEGLGGNVDDTDPQRTGVPPLDPVASDDASKRPLKSRKSLSPGARGPQERRARQFAHAPRDRQTAADSHV
jgi:hypothetical protein